MIGNPEKLGRAFSGGATFLLDEIRPSDHF